MTQTSPDTSLQAQPPSRAFRPLAWLFGLLVRLLLLGILGSAGAAAGILWAINQPRDTAAKPYFLTAWENWQTPDSAAVPTPLPSPTPTAPPSPPPGTVTPEQRRQLEQQVLGLRQQFEGVFTDTEALEERFGLEAGDQTLPERLEALRQRVRTLPPAPEPPPPELPPLASNANLRLGQRLRSPYDLDSLLAEDNTISDQGQRQLFHLVQELRKYPGATVRIGVHLDRGEAPATQRQRSLELAGVLEQYLRQELPESDRYTWIPIGFGDSRPLVPNDTAANRQRNRRVDIGVD